MCHDGNKGSKVSYIQSVPAQPIDYLVHGLRPPKNKNKIEYNLWENIYIYIYQL